MGADVQVIAHPNEVVNLQTAIAEVYRRRRFVLLCTVATALVTAIVVLVLPPRYTAEAIVLPPAQSGSMSSLLMGQLGGASSFASMAGAGLGIKNAGDMYVSLFSSRTVEDAVIHKFDLMTRYKAKRLSDARMALEKRTAVVLGTKDGLIRITVEDGDPNKAAEIVNGYVSEVKKRSADLAVSEASQRRVFFERQLLEANENLAGAEETLKKTEQKTGVLQVDSQARSLIESAAAIRAQIVAKQVQLEGMRTYATDNNPQLIEVKQQITELQSQLASLAGTDDKASSDIVIHKGNIPEAGMEYLRRLRDVKYDEAIVELIGKQYEVAKLDEEKQGAPIQVVDDAVAPDRRSSPKRTADVLIFTILGFLFSIGFVLSPKRLFTIPVR